MEVFLSSYPHIFFFLFTFLLRRNSQSMLLQQPLLNAAGQKRRKKKQGFLRDLSEDQERKSLDRMGYRPISLAVSSNRVLAEGIDPFQAP